MKTKILFFIPTISNGGAEKVLITLLNNINHDKFEISVCTLFKDFHSSLLLPSIRYHYIFPIKFRGNVFFLKMFPRGFLFNHTIGKLGSFDIIVSYLQSPTMRIVAGCSNPNSVLINWIHNEFSSLHSLSYMFSSKSDFISAMQRYDRTVFVARSAQKSLCEMLPFLREKSEVVYNTIDTDYILSLAQKKLDDDIFFKDKINIISMGRFTKAKAFDRLIRIVYRLKEKGILVRLFLLGSGNLEEYYKMLVKKYDLRGDVVFLGFKENPYKYLSKADLFVCSSIHEGYSTSVTESLILGVPVVTTECSGMRELLGENCEYGLISENNEDALFDLLFNVLSDKKKLQDLAAKAKERGMAFKKENLISITEDFFNRMLKNK